LPGSFLLGRVFLGSLAELSVMVKALALPDGRQCFGALMLGYPRFACQRLPLRKPPVISWWDER
jgi:hypothetical protein